ncbi:hypothetical protein EJB05_12105, partial [Eragrostis curvula]
HYSTFDNGVKQFPKCISINCGRHRVHLKSPYKSGTIRENKETDANLATYLCQAARGMGENKEIDANLATYLYIAEHLVHHHSAELQAEVLITGQEHLGGRQQEVEQGRVNTRLVASKSIFITLNSTQRHNHSLVIGRKQIRALPQTPAVRPEQKLHFQQQPSPIPAAVTRAPLQ